MHFNVGNCQYRFIFSRGGRNSNQALQICLFLWLHLCFPFCLLIFNYFIEPYEENPEVFCDDDGNYGFAYIDHVVMSPIQQKNF